MNKFSERLKELRAENNISQTELAKALKVVQRCVSGWENQGREPNYDVIIEIAKYFTLTSYVI